MSHVMIPNRFGYS